MKNYLFFILTCILFVSCTPIPTDQNDIDTEGTSVVTHTVNGKYHEFVGILHWPGCKYCKIDSIN